MSAKKDNIITILKRLGFFVLVLGYAFVFFAIIYGIGMKSGEAYINLFCCYVSAVVLYCLLTSHIFASIFEKVLRIKSEYYYIDWVRIIVYALYIIALIITTYLNFKNMSKNIPFSAESILYDNIFVPILATCVAYDRLVSSIKKVQKHN